MSYNCVWLEKEKEKNGREKEGETKDDNERELHRSMCQCACTSEPARSFCAMRTSMRMTTFVFFCLENRGQKKCSLSIQR